MEHYAGIDVSLEQTSVCVVDATGTRATEAKVTSDPQGRVLCRERLGGLLRYYHQDAA